MPNQEVAKNLAKLMENFNDRRVITDGQVQEVLTAIVTILAENKKGVETLNTETKKQLESAVSYLEGEHRALVQAIQGDLSSTKAEIEHGTREQNQRAFKQLQTLISKIKLPKDGKPGKAGKDGKDGKDGVDGSPDTAEQVRDKLEALKDEDRLDASAIKNLPRFIKEKGREMLVGGIRFLENLADVSVPIAKKREDLLIQYDTTNKRWEDGVALTVSTTAPTSPKVNDLWVDIN